MRNPLETHDQWLWSDLPVPEDRIAHDGYLRNNMLRVAFQPGNICTYDCIYCPPGAKNGSDKWPSIDRVEGLIHAIDGVYRKPPYNKADILYEWQGGEVTVWPEFDRALAVLRNLGSKSDLITNGSRSLRWWRENARSFRWVTFSFHPQFADKQHTLEVLNLLSDEGVCCCALVLMLPSHWDKCMDAIRYLEENCRCTQISAMVVNQIDSTPDRDHQIWDGYTEEQLETIRSIGSFMPKNAIPGLADAANTHTQMLRNSGTGGIYLTDTHEMLRNQHSNWLGWHCMIGIDTLFLSKDGSIRIDAMCDAGPSLGNWRTDDVSQIRWPTSGVVCPRTYCACAHDMRARKFKNSSHAII